MKCLCLLLLLVLSCNSNLLIAQNEVLEYAFRFETAQSKLPQEAQESITLIAKQAQKWTTHKIIIQGHTDDIGDSTHNVQLSQSRAEEVKDLFVAAGIDATRIKINAFGEEAPLVSNRYEGGRKENRRVEIFLTNETELTYLNQQKRNQQFLEQLRPESPRFLLEQTTIDHYLTTEQGTKIHVPIGAFDVPEGTVVELKVTEAYKKSAMILNGLSTMSNGKQLVTGGMIKVEALANGTLVALKEGKELGINVPTKQPNRRMKLFYADASARTINWVNPQPLGINRPRTVKNDAFYQEFNLSQYDNRYYGGARSLRPDQIFAKRSKRYLSKKDLYPRDESKDLSQPEVPKTIDSSRVNYWKEALVKATAEINTPCTSFICKFKAFFQSKKKKAALKEEDEKRLKSIRKNIKTHEDGLVRQEAKQVKYAEDIVIYQKTKDSLKRIYLARMGGWSEEALRIDSVNFRHACDNRDVGYLFANFSRKEKEACQEMYGVNTYEEAQAEERANQKLDYIAHYMPKGNNLDDVALKAFLAAYPTIELINKRHLQLAYAKKDTNYVRWRKGRKAVKLALPIMYNVGTLKEARAAQLQERIHARKDFYAKKMKEFGVNTIEEAYAAHQKLLKAEAEWEKQVGYVFETANLGNWINCDYFPGKSKEELITQNFDLPVSPKATTTYLIFKDIASVMSGSPNYEGLNSWYTFNNIPKNKMVQVVSFYLDKQGQTHAVVKSLLANEKVEKLEYEPMSIEAFKEVLISLDV